MHIKQDIQFYWESKSLLLINHVQTIFKHETFTNELWKSTIIWHTWCILFGHILKNALVFFIM